MSEIRKNSYKAWILAARPQTLAGATIPVVLGMALAYADGAFLCLPGMLCLLFAYLMQIDANLINDLFDFLNGADRKEDRLGPDRACIQGWVTLKAMKISILVITLLAGLVGLLLLSYGGWKMLPIGVACILFAFLYTAGPYPLSYKGWGDLLVLLFFGVVPVGCTYYVMAHDWTIEVLLVSIACGLVIDTMLMINNYRDIEQDIQSGKRTLVVRLGRNVGGYLYLILGIVAVFLCLPLYSMGEKEAPLLVLFYLIPHLFNWKRMLKETSFEGMDAVFGANVRNMLLFGLLLTIGLIF